MFRLVFCKISYQNPQVWSLLASSAGCYCLWHHGGWSCWCAGAGGPAKKGRLTGFSDQHLPSKLSRLKALLIKAVCSVGGCSVELYCTALSPLPRLQKAQTYHESLVQDVGNNGFIHSVSSLQHAFSQICHRAAIAELQQKNPQRNANNEKKLNMSQHIELNLNNMLKSGASEMRRGSRGETAEDENVFDHKISQQEERRWK